MDAGWKRDEKQRERENEGEQKRGRGKTKKTAREVRNLPFEKNRERKKFQGRNGSPGGREKEGEREERERE